MTERDIQKPISLKEGLAIAAKTPYNSVAGIYRICGVDTETNKYGNDCLGQLKQIVDLLPTTSTVLYIRTEFRGARHLAAIIDGCYVDPFLSQTEPVPLREINGGETVLTNTLAPDQKIELSLNSHLNVRLIKVFPGRQSRRLIEYSYDLETASTQIPDDSEFVNISIPYMLHFIATEGIYIRINYDCHKAELKTFMFNSDGERVGNTEEFCEKALLSQYGLNFKQLKEYFVAANELQKYVNWWKKKK